VTRRAASIAVAIAATLLAARDARAVDPFEIQVYDGTADAPGTAGLEAHLNHVANGVRDAEYPELAPHRQSHLTFEPSFGVTRFWELGAYLQTAVRGDGSYDYAGVKLRSKFVTPPEKSLRLGLNLELSNIPETYDRHLWGGEIRPILAWETKYTLLAANPIVSRSDTWSFEPAVKAMLMAPGFVGGGLEYYGSTDGEHYLYEVVDLLSEEDLELEAGVGEGLTGQSNPLVFKVIVGIAFDVASKKGAKSSARPCLSPWRATARASTTR